MKTLDEQLEALGTLFQQHGGAPPSPSPAPPAEVSGHPDLVRLWAWGLAPAMFAEGALGFDEEQRWLTAPESAAALAEMLGAVPEYPRTYVPLSTDEAGNYTCLDTATGHVMDWDHETRLSRLYTRSLTAFLDSRRTRAARALRERAAQAKAAAEPRKPPPAAGAMPRTIKRVPQTALNRFDSRGFSGGVARAALSPDGRLVAMGTNNLALLWNLEAEAHVKLGHSVQKHMFAFDATSQRMLCRSYTGMQVVDTATGQAHLAWEAPGLFNPGACGFSADGSLVYALSFDRVLAWSLESLPAAPEVIALGQPLPEVAPLAALPAQSEGMWQAVSAADDGTLLVLDTTYQKRQAVLWSPRADRVVATLRFPEESAVGSALALSPDGRQCALLVGDDLCLYDLGEAFTLRQRIPNDLGYHDLRGLGFDRTGQVLVASGKEQVRLWDVASGKVLASVPAKSKNHAPQVTLCTVTASHVLTVEPLALFSLHA